MWLDRTINAIVDGPRLVHLQCGPEAGTHFVISELHTRKRPIVWLHLDQADSGIGVGNKLSDAIDRAFGFRLFGYGLPLSYCLRRLDADGCSLGRYHLVVSGEPSTGTDLSPLYALRVPSLFAGRSFVVPEQAEALVLTEDDIRLSIQDAEDIADRRMPKQAVRVIHEASNGMYEHFLVRLQGTLELPPPERPYPEHYLPIGGALAQPDLLIDAHVKRGFWMEAFEVAARSCAERVPNLVDNAAEQYLDRNLVERFADRLASLPDDLLHVENVAYWRLSAAIATNTHRAQIPKIRSLVRVSEMPMVRAVLATQELTKSSLSETRAALDTSRNLVTMRAHAFCLTQFGRPEEAISLLMAALDEAQLQGSARELISIGSYIAHAVALKGEYSAALSWAEWALSGFHKYGVNDEIEQLYIKSQVQYMRILSGINSDTPVIDPALVHFELTGVPTFEAVVSTIGDYEFAHGRYEIALEMYERNRSVQSRDQVGHFTLDSCRALLALDRLPAAVELADGALALAEGTNELNQLKARLAWAVAHTAACAGSAERQLEDALDLACSLDHWDVAAFCGIVLASDFLARDRPVDAGAALSRCRRGLEHLGPSGWKLFGAWLQNVGDVQELWGRARTPLHLTFLGRASYTRDGQETRLSMRNAEILAVLSMHRNGLSGEQLSERLYENERTTSTLKANLSKLRHVVPIKSQPYRIAEFFVSDLQLIEDMLRQGRTYEALNLYCGPFLPESSAPAIVAHREYLEEAVRQAVLSSGDVECLLRYAEIRTNDLEVWEALESLVGDEDARAALVRARVASLRVQWGVA